MLLPDDNNNEVDDNNDNDDNDDNNDDNDDNNYDDDAYQDTEHSNHISRHH